MGDWTDPEPMRAPWRGEFDMPGNFERNQSMANSLAEDEALRTGLSHSFRYDPTKPYGVEVFKGSPAQSAMFSDDQKASMKEKLFFSGPPEWSQSPGSWGAGGSGWGLRDPSGGQPISQNEIDTIMRSVLGNSGDRYNSKMADMYARAHKGNPLYEELIGSKLEAASRAQEQKRAAAAFNAGQRYTRGRRRDGLHRSEQQVHAWGHIPLAEPLQGPVQPWRRQRSDHGRPAAATADGAHEAARR
jgi:hypothetical protein